jgi:hypothetical protein
MATKLKKKFESAQSILHAELSKCVSVGLTHDSWTSLLTQSYDTVTAHYISPEWQLHSAVLRTSHFKGSHTGENISNHLRDTLKYWDIKDSVFVTDNAANEQKALRLLGLPRIGCYGHRLNLVVKHALADPQAAELISKGRSLVTFFHTSTTATELLLEKQKLLLPKEAQSHRLIQDVQTRWNSTLEILKRLDEQTLALHAVVTDGGLGKRSKDLGNKVFSFDEQAEVKSLIDVLEPFKKATETLSSDKEPTLGLVLPSLFKLSKALEIKPEESEMIRNVKIEMKAQLEARTQDRDFALMATFLSPSTKSMWFLSADDRLKAQDLVQQELLSSFEKSEAIKKEKQDAVSDENDNLIEPSLPELQQESDDDIQMVEENIICEPEIVPAKKIKIEDVNKSSDSKNRKSQSASWLDDVLFVSETKPPPLEELIQSEMKGYIAEPPNNTECTNLDWWKRNEGKYPKLARMAKKYLSIPASSVSAERVFSMTGNIISKKRSRLKPELVDIIVFLNKNKYLYKK